MVIEERERETRLGCLRYQRFTSNMFSLIFSPAHALLNSVGFSFKVCFIHLSLLMGIVAHYTGDNEADMYNLSM